MLAPSNDWLRAGLGLKLNQVKLATRSYLRDRTSQATDAVSSYAIAAGLFAASGVFLLAACLVGVMALFRWIEIAYGRFPAFGAVGALLLVIAAICAAIKASPVRPDQIEAVRDTAAAILLDSSTSSPGTRPRAPSHSARDSRDLRAGLILMATLLGWAAARRRRQARRMQA
jgi:hypothetical protein